MAIHVENPHHHKGWGTPYCHGINLSRVSKRAVPREEFEKVRPDWQCKKCVKMLTAYDAWKAKETNEEMGTACMVTGPGVANYDPVMKFQGQKKKTLRAVLRRKTPI